MKAKIKVLFLVEYLYQGGIERFLEQFARNLNKSNIEIHFFAYEMEELNGMAKEIKELNHPITIYKKLKGYDIKLLKKLITYIKAEGIDIIHTQDFGPMEYALPLKFRFPILKLLHTQHTLHHFVINLKYTLFFQFAALFYHRIFTVSNHVKDVLKKKFIISSNMEVIFNGVDPDHFSKCYREMDQGAPLNIVSIARISKEKNLLHSLKACKVLQDRGIDFTFSHVGSGDEEEERVMQEYVRDNGLIHHISFHGHQTDITPFLKKADLFISSSFTEGHPIAVLEAMAAKKICLISDIKAHRLFGTDSVLFFNLDDPLSLPNLIQKVGRDRLGYRPFCDMGHIEVRKRFSLELMLTNYSNYYN